MIIDQTVYWKKIADHLLRYSQDILIFSPKNLLNTASVSTYKQLLAKNIKNYVS